MCKLSYLDLLVIVYKFFEEYIIDRKHLEIKGLDFAAIVCAGCYRTSSIQYDLLLYAVVYECDEIPEFLRRVNNIDFRKYKCRLCTFRDRASSNENRTHVISLAQRGFIYIEHAGENLIYCPFCFNFFYSHLVNEENVCNHAENCPYAVRAWDQHGNTNLGVMNLAVDIEDREIYRNDENLFNLPFSNAEGTRQDIVNTSELSISIRNLNEFQDIHSRENRIDNQSSVAQNLYSSNLVHQETETNVIALSDTNGSLDNVITQNSASLSNVLIDLSSNSSVSNIVSTASDLLPCATTTSSVVSFNRTAITAPSTTTGSTNIALDRNFTTISLAAAKQKLASYVRETLEVSLRPTLDSAVRQRLKVVVGQRLASVVRQGINVAVRQISEEKVTQILEEAVRQISEEAVRQISEEAVRQISEEAVRQISEEAQIQISKEAVRKISEEYAIRQMSEEAVRRVSEETVRSISEEAVRQISEEVVRQISEEALRQIPEEALRQISEEGVRKISEEAVRKISNEDARQTSVEVVRRNVSETNRNFMKGNAGEPTYSELGIVTERPKRFEYAVLAKRMETFLSWPRDHRLRPKELVEAGFYYAGYGDCARCFYCGGGLRNWEDEDDVWVEHARWFPKCAYIRQQMGQVFVDIVQELNKTHDHISFKMVMEKIVDDSSAYKLDTKDFAWKRYPAFNPFREVIDLAEAIKNDAFSENIRTSREQNHLLRHQTVCKICMDKEVAVVCLGCGDLVFCNDCASAMKACPVCRKHVKCIVRAFMG